MMKTDHNFRHHLTCSPFFSMLLLLLLPQVEWQYTEAGERVRVAVKTGTVMTIPSEAERTVDYQARGDYKANDEKDTLPKEVERVTYEPGLQTFEMAVMEKMGIKETREPRKSYWY